MKLSILIIIAITRVDSAPSVSQLYLPEDDVEILDIENFKTSVENSTNAWLVEFYAAWCGHCQRFSKPWKEFSTEVALWRDKIRVGVLACSDDANTPICREYEIKKYPVVKYFHENYQSSVDLGVSVSLKSSDTVQTIKEVVIETIVTEINEGRGLIYPNLLPYVHPDLTELFTGLEDSIQFVFLIVEEPGSYLGAEVALDVHRTPNVSIRHSFSNNTILIKTLQLDKFPFVIVTDRKNNTEIFTKTVSNKNDVKKAIDNYLQTRNLKIVEIIPPKIYNTSVNVSEDEGTKTLRLYIKNMGDVIFQTDLEATLRYSLKHEVSTFKLIKDEELQALQAYLKVIKQYFPFGYNSTSFIDNLISLASAEEVEGVQIQLLVEEAENNGIFSSPGKFLGCLGSSSRYRGYPCSLWGLFHFLTINSFLFGNDTTNPRQVLDAIHGYVKNFFSCKYCSQHFQQMVVDRKMNVVSTSEEAVFWLWEAHNAVNQRLKGDSTEDPEYPKAQFPGEERCPECYDKDGAWKREEVLKYLVRMYKKYSVRYIGADTKVLFPGLD